MPDESEKLTAIEDWMITNLLQLNGNKTEVLIIAPDNIASKVAQCTGPLSSAVRSNFRNLGVIIDQAL